MLLVKVMHIFKIHELFKKKKIIIASHKELKEVKTVIMEGLSFLKCNILKFFVSNVSGVFYWNIQSLQQKIIKLMVKKKEN